MRQRTWVRKEDGLWIVGCQCCGTYVFADPEWTRAISYAFIHARLAHSWRWAGLGPVGQ